MITKQKNKNIFEQYGDLFKKIGFTLFILALYKIIGYIAVPGVNIEILSSVVNSSSVLKSLDLYTGGSLEKCSILALSVTPYINASILVQLLSSKFGGFDTFMKLKEEGELGKQKLAEYTQYLSLIFAILYAVTYSLYAAYQTVGNVPVVFINKWLFLAISIPSLVTGAVFTSWLGGQIQKKGIGSGVSVLLGTNILLSIPSSFTNLTKTHPSTWAIVLSVLSILFMFLFIVNMESTVRNVPVMYPVQGKKQFALPISFNSPGIMPTIFVGQLTSIPQIILSILVSTGVEASLLKKVVSYIDNGTVFNTILQAVLVVYFTFVCSEFSFNVEENAKNLHKSGAIVTGIRPGEKTAQYFAAILSKLNYLTGLYLAVVCVLFNFLAKKYNLNISGSSILIMITTVMEAMRQASSFFLSKKQYSLMSSMLNNPLKF